MEFATLSNASILRQGEGKLNSRVKVSLGLVILVIGIAFFGLRWWQGPTVAAYQVASSPLVQTVVATGRVITLSRTAVSSEITAIVLERKVQEGDRVRQGDLMLQLRSTELAAQVRQAQVALEALASSRRPQAAVTLTRAEVQLLQAQREVKRRRELFAQSMLSSEALELAEQAERLAQNNLMAAQIDLTALAPNNVEEMQLRERLEALQAQLDKTQVRAEVSGVVLTRDVEPGDLVQPGHVLFTIAAEGATELLVALDERNLSRLALAQHATVIADAFPSKPFSAKLHFIAPVVDPARGTVDVRLLVEPVPDFLLQDMTVSVNIETGRRDNALVLPNDALTNIVGEQADVLLLKSGRVQRHKVQLGLRGLALSEIISGLAAGDTVLADPTQAIANGSRVRVYRQETLPLIGATSEASRNELPVKFN
ncbi:MAG: efflux RND transporter periplasmic adaptor subunit [Paraglaciecola sp.]|nr:efflux RND transporter periplasmic adaptor subunit [Paraglaciecola sp.]